MFKNKIPFVFLSTHFIIWFLLPVLLVPNMPLDFVESLSWGQLWQWGYDKHPPLSAWIGELSFSLFQNNVIGLYFASQICILLTFYWTYLFSRKYLSIKCAWMSVLILECIYYYNFTSYEFNPNVLLLPLWIKTIDLYDECLSKDRWLDWTLLSLFCVLGLLTKYTIVFLFLMMMFYSFFMVHKKSIFLNKKFYLFIVLTGLMLIPHIYWLINSDFLTIRYAIERSHTQKLWWNHIYYPLKFFLSQLCALLLLFILFYLIFKPKKYQRGTNEKFYFLEIFTWGPLILLMCISLVLGIKIRSMWATPLFSLVGVYLFYSFPVERTYQKENNFYRVILVVICIFCLGFMGQFKLGPYLNHKGKRAHFPGFKLSQIITNYWNETFHEKISYVAGDRWLIGNVNAFSPDRPVAFIDADPARNPWIQLDDFKNKGAIFLWDISRYGEYYYQRWLAQYPELKIQPEIKIPMLTNAPVKVARVGWAIFNPQINSKFGFDKKNQ